ncbi:MAG: DUF4389 domain-containing protein [SAR324 cluster bacterium]|nr:DUF4389 domain-containing protein [SAR324 cluster bacterium]
MAKNQKAYENQTGGTSFFGNEELSLQWIGIRLLYTLLFMFIFAISKTIVQLTLVFQFIYLFFVRRPNEQARIFSNSISTYAYKVLRYVTLNDEQRPFPFSDWPDALEPPEGSE